MLHKTTVSQSVSGPVGRSIEQGVGGSINFAQLVGTLFLSHRTQAPTSFSVPRNMLLLPSLDLTKEQVQRQRKTHWQHQENPVASQAAENLLCTSVEQWTKYCQV